MKSSNHFLNREVPVQRHGAKLPHWQQGSVIQFVTFRLRDSIPREKLLELDESMRDWLRNHSGREAQRELILWQRRVELSLQKWMDRGHGECLFAKPFHRNFLKETILYGDNRLYHLLSWVIMPNHVHVLFSPNGPIQKIVQSWKVISAKRVGRGPIWQKGYYDVAIRNHDQFRYVALYIRRNPSGLARSDFSLWESESTKYFL